MQNRSCSPTGLRRRQNSPTAKRAAPSVAGLAPAVQMEELEMQVGAAAGRAEQVAASEAATEEITEAGRSAVATRSRRGS
eukprot:512059-Prymnesium_polylepis.1